MQTITTTGDLQPTMQRDGLSMTADKEQMAMSLKTYRLRQGFTQDKLGKRWGCSRYTIMRIEKGKPVTWEMMYRVFNELSKALIAEVSEKTVQHL